jgi:hypothetical protein
MISKEKMDINAMIKGFDVRREEKKKKNERKTTVESTIKETRKLSLSFLDALHRQKHRDLWIFFYVRIYIVNEENY